MVLHVRPARYLLSAAVCDNSSTNRQFEMLKIRRFPFYIYFV
jgi:hypothetical protein